MNLWEAWDWLTETDNFKTVAKMKNKDGSKLRMMKHRMEYDWVNATAIINCLRSFGYEVDVTVSASQDDYPTLVEKYNLLEPNVNK